MLKIFTFSIVKLFIAHFVYRRVNDTKLLNAALPSLWLKKAWNRGVKLVGFWGPHCTYEQSCRGPHEVFELEIATSLGNDLSNAARSKVDLKKKKKGYHFCTIVIRATNRVLWLHKVKLPPNEKNSTP